MAHEPTAPRPVDPQVVEALVRNHRAFLGFLEKRVDSRTTAEEILQSAFVKALEKSDHVQPGEGAIRWFYRLLRNAVIDHSRRRGVETRLFAHPGLGADASEAPDADFENAICECIETLLPTLKAPYAELIRKGDLEGQSVAELAAASGITQNNALVRLHRARQALRKRLVESCGTCATHGCLDCGCKKAQARPQQG